MASNTPFDGPIPGENYTSDTKNYPWHRPPEVTTLDDGIEASMKKLATREAVYGLLTALQGGVSVAQMTTTFITSGIGAGKWSVDLGILLAGPVSRIMQLLAEGYGIKYDMGLEEDAIPTIEFFKNVKIDPNKAVQVATDVATQTDEIKQQAAEQEQTPSNPQAAMRKGGFMGEAGPDLGAVKGDTPPEEEVVQ